MDYLENELNKRFKDQELPNNQFETEDLWGEIANELDEGKVFGESSILSKRNMLMLFFASLGLVASLTFYNQSEIVQDSQSEIDYTKSDEVSISGSSSSLTANGIDGIEEASVTKIISSDSENNNATIHSTRNVSVKKIQSTADLKTDSKGRLERNTITSNGARKKLNQQILKEKIDELSIAEPAENLSTNVHAGHMSIKEEEVAIYDNRETETSIGLIGTSESKLGFDKRVLKAITLIESLQIDLGLTSQSKHLMPILSDTLIEEIQEASRDSIPFFITAFSGINAVDYKFASDDYEEIALLKNEAENLYAGSSYGIHFGAKFKKWTISSGLEYHQLWSEFDYSGTRQVPRTIENVRTKIWRDVNTGDDLYFILDDVIVNDLETRRVRHYNSIQRFSVPLRFGYQKELAKFDLNLDFGPVFNFTTMQSGKLLIANKDVVEFEGTGANSPFDSFDITLMVSPSIGYNLSDKWQLLLSPQWRWSPSRLYSGSDFEISNSQWNFNVGLRYLLSK